jgi:hypothetical protein
MKSVIVVGLLVIVPGIGWAQSSTDAGAVPHTPWGAPDLQGVWDFRTITPLERPSELAGKDVLTDEEAAEQEQRTAEGWVAQRRATRRAASWERPIRERVAGYIPNRIADGPEDLGLAERCLLGFNSGPPMLPSVYNNIMQLFQTPGYVVILNEMVHDARIIPLDGRAHLPEDLRQWMGDARGHWEGNTLVVDSTNFTNKTSSFSPAITSGVGTGETLHLTERFSRVDEQTLVYEYTVDDPVTFTRSFTAEIPMKKSEWSLFEYACHEGNYAMPNTLAGARAEEAAAGIGSR